MDRAIKSKLISYNRRVSSCISLIIWFTKLCNWRESQSQWATRNWLIMITIAKSPESGTKLYSRLDSNKIIMLIMALITRLQNIFVNLLITISTKLLKAYLQGQKRLHRTFWLVYTQRFHSFEWLTKSCLLHTQQFHCFVWLRKILENATECSCITTFIEVRGFLKGRCT